MKPYYEDESVTVFHGDCLDVLAGLPDACVDSVVTDPPYGLEFMGKDWDAPWKATDALATARMSGDVIHDPSAVGGFQDGAGGNPYSRSRIRYGREGNDMLGFQQWCQLWAAECLRVLKPGGHLLAFGGTRTWHRLAAAVEDAGFEIRDNIAWLYGSGFPKSLDVSKAIDKAAGAERETIRHAARAGTSGTMSGKSDTRPWIERSRERGYHEVAGPDPVTDDAKRWAGWGTALKPAFEPVVVGRKPLAGTVAGNVLAHGVGALNIDGCRVATNDKLGGGHSSSGQQMKDGWKRPWMDDPDAVAANAERSRASVAKSEELGRWPSNVVVDEHAAAEIDRQSGHSKTPDTVTRGGKRSGNSGLAQLGRQCDVPCYGDEGGASRFFPTFRYQAKAATDERPTANGIAHPTVKPLNLMRWLIRLVTPPGGIVLEPFAGSGTTAEACIHEHMRCIAIERETDYLPVIVARLSKPMEIGFDFGAANEI